MQQAANARLPRTWRVALVTRIAFGFLAAFLLGIAGLMFALPIMYGGKDDLADALIIASGLVQLGFGVFATFALAAVVQTHVTLDEKTLEATVIEGHNWFLVPRFRSFRLSLRAVRSVERRSEIKRMLGMSTVREALSIVTTGGTRIGLFSDTLGSADTLPIDDVANAIATAAGIAVTDDGTVLTKGSGLYGAASSSWTERPLDAATASKARRAAIVTAQICSALILLTFVIRALL
jgi:hypothetical protein